MVGAFFWFGGSASEKGVKPLKYSNNSSFIKDLKMLAKIQRKNRQKIVDLNRNKAIRERCLNCSAWMPKEVRNCEFPDCSLYPFRSGKGKQDPKLRTKAIKEYCSVDQPGEVTKCPCTDCSLFPYRQSRIDRSVEIDSVQEMQQIEGSIETISVE